MSKIKKNTNVVTTTEVELDSQTLAAKKSLDWLDTTKDKSDDIYRINGYCNSAECREYTLGNKSWREEPYLIWGRYKYYEKTNDTEQLKKLDVDFDYLSKRPLQLVNWGCRLVKDMVLSDVLSEKDKEKARTICAIGGYEGKEEFVAQEDQTIFDAMVQIINNQKINTENGSSEETKRLFDQNAFISSDYTAIYEIKIYDSLTSQDGQKLPVLNVAKNRFLKALYGYSLMDENEKSVYSNSILGVAALDLYKTENKKEYLDFAVKLEEFNDNNTLKKEIKDVAYHAYFVNELSKVDGYENNKTKFENDVDLLVNSYFDGAGYGGNRFDRGAFYDPKNTQYSSTLNGLIIGLIMSK